MSQSKNSPDSGGLDDRAESFIVVDTGLLGETTEHPTSLVSVQRAISMELVFENPFPGDHIGLVRPRDRIPSVVDRESIKFFLHGLAPNGISKGILTGPG
jgi:hypothetical protein